MNVKGPKAGERIEIEIGAADVDKVAPVVGVDYAHFLTSMQRKQGSVNITGME
jgi:hypothetical protein